MLSIILLSYYSKERIAEAYSKVSKVMETNNIPFEFIIIDDGSLDEFMIWHLSLKRVKRM